jgi:aryl-alcohol dehydrogenase-like predicted oxidoreductase
MQRDFLRAPLGKLGTPVCRIGLSATYRPGRATIHKALDEGLNYFQFFGFDTQMSGVLREALAGRRERYVLSSGAYNLIWTHQNLRRTLERRLRQVRTDYLDIFHFFGVTRRKYFTARVREELQAVRESGLVRAVGISTHDCKFAAELLGEGTLDAAMVHYNAAQRGAEVEVFPRLPESNPAVVAFTATRWGSLLRRPRGYPQNARVPAAGMCYRFVLGNPAVHVCMMAPSNLGQFESNLADIRRGPLPDDEMKLMREFGDAVYRAAKRR